MGHYEICVEMAPTVAHLTEGKPCTKQWEDKNILRSIKALLFSERYDEALSILRARPLLADDEVGLIVQNRRSSLQNVENYWIIRRNLLKRPFNRPPRSSYLEYFTQSNSEATSLYRLAQYRPKLTEKSTWQLFFEITPVCTLLCQKTTLHSDYPIHRCNFCWQAKGT
jgi:hypothetical protein